MKRLYIIAALLFLAAIGQCAAAQTTQAQCNTDTASPSVQLISGITTTSYTDSTPVDNTTYAYIVTANDFAGFACSNLVLNVTIPITGTHTVALSWVASTTSGVTYSVFRAQVPVAPTGLTVTVN
jgi:hypothetical protein